MNFWASWCVECQQEAHILEAFHKRYGETVPPQVHILGVAIQDKSAQAQAFARQFNKTYFLSLDNTGGDIALEYGIYGVPETFFIDPQGKIRFKQIGGVSAELMQEQVDEMLGQGKF